MMQGLNPSYGLLACAATLVAFGAPSKDRTRAVLAGLLILIGWGLWVCSYGPNSPAGLLYRLGVKDIEHSDVWAMVDALTSTAILAMAYHTRWGWGLWGAIVCQIVMHGANRYGGLPYPAYLTALDALFLAQLAILFSVGGRGCADTLSAICRHGRHVLRSPRSTPGEA